MVSIPKSVWDKLLSTDFLNDWKTLEQILKRLGGAGFTIKGKQIGGITKALTKMCQDFILEREAVGKTAVSQSKWRYRKVR